MQNVTIEWLKSIEAIKDVPDAQLQWLIDNSRHFIVPSGELLFKQGDPMDATIFIISGGIRLLNRQQNEEVEIALYEQKSITGYLPFSRGKKTMMKGEAISDTQIMSLPVEKSQELIRTHYELTQALVHIMTTRVRDFTSQQQQNEKMMALGKLSAGLAHELNNPAAAVVRGAVSLKNHLKLLPDFFKKIISIQMTAEDVDLVTNMMFAVLDQPKKPPLAMMVRSIKEDEVTDWLCEYKVENCEEIAENFVEFGFGVPDLEEFRKHIPELYLSPVFNWINNNLVTEKMVTDIEEASGRIATLVSSVKSFTHMDQGNSKQLTDVHAGIESTLAMLQYKIRKGNVELAKRFADDLPRINGLPGELNQVWTNLIDNALDAMEINGKGLLVIQTEKKLHYVQVSVIDNGPGIPDDILSKIFDPFFTTKSIGKGTGLGLDIAAQIVRQHKGSMKVSSAPGRTEFTVSLPY